MPFEDKPPTIAPLPVSVKTLLTWRRCVKCGNISYCPPDSTCRCGGLLGRYPGWPTMIAPSNVLARESGHA